MISWLARSTARVSIAFLMMAGFNATARPANGPVTHATTTYKYLDIDGLKIFYREAGLASAPTILLLHGLPSSSRMFDALIPLLADNHLIAPDYPGFGHSDAPSPDKFS
ncbi:MAG: alpha/beta fold hydrolase [Pseudolabrys sp.]